MKRQYGKVTVIQAKVPISMSRFNCAGSTLIPTVKAKDPKANLAMDININDRLGLFNTDLLEHYCRLWPPLSNLIYVIKKWAKARGLNEPAGAKRGGPTFSSYCLTLMIVGFLQVICRYVIACMCLM
jgi:DNA polymerase sigma